MDRDSDAVSWFRVLCFGLVPKPNYMQNDSTYVYPKGPRTPVIGFVRLMTGGSHLATAKFRIREALGGLARSERLGGTLDPKP